MIVWKQSHRKRHSQWVEQQRGSVDKVSLMRTNALEKRNTISINTNVTAQKTSHVCCHFDGNYKVKLQIETTAQVKRIQKSL